MLRTRLFTVSDAARVLQVTPGAVRHMLKRGTIPLAERTAGGIHLVLGDDVYRLAAERKAQRALKGESSRKTDSTRRSGGGR